MSVRLDMWLVQHGIFGGRDTAKRHIEAGEVSVNGRVIKKASVAVSEDDTVTCETTEKYVGRGGYKLQKAIVVSGVSPCGCVALDVGASTGGFTDCMLQNGAEKVYAVDVGRGQLHPRLKEDSRVISLEETDIRSPYLTEIFKETPSFCSIDVSFISLKTVLPYVLPHLSEDAVVVCLIKPQFEAGRAALNKNGVVRDASVHKTVLREMYENFIRLNCGVVQFTYSPIRGGEGNVEYLAVVRRNHENRAVDISALVQEAFSVL